MRQHSPGFYLGLIAAIILGFGIAAGAWLGLNAISGLGYEPGVLQAQKTGPKSATITLSSYPDSMVCHQGADAQQLQWVTFCPTTKLEIPANSVVTVNILQYDTATTLVNDYYRQVHGTIGGTMLVNNQSMTEIGADQPGHTFTIQSTANSAYPIFVSVPLLGVSANAPNLANGYPKPNVISFQFRTGPAGITYIWHCYVPCGSPRGAPFGFSGPMSTTGWMSGTLTVSNY
jgi:hypothetical protein